MFAIANSIKTINFAAVFRLSSSHMGFFSTKSLALSDFEQFSVRSDFSEEAMIGRSLFSLFGKNRFKAISSLSFQRYRGETTSIVNDFKKALSQKYGDGIAGFVFSQQYEQSALAQGLTKRAIAAVLKKAVVLQESHFSNYQQALQTTHDAMIKVVETLKGTSCYTVAQRKYKVIQEQLQEFNQTLTHFEPDLKSNQQDQRKLQNYFQEKLTHVDGLAHSIVALSDVEEKIRKIFGDAEQSQEMLKVFLQHQRVMEDLRNQFNGTSGASRAREAMMEISKSLDPLVRTIEKAAETLSSFSSYFCEENSFNCFSLNQRGEVIVQDQTENSVSVKRAQEHAATIFFDALKQCYGTDFINKLRPLENQNQPLSVSEAIEIFKNIHETFKNLGAFFQKQPLLITKEYLDVLLTHPHLASQTEHDDQQLKSHERSQVQLMRRMINTFILSSGHYAASSSYSLIAGAHASHLVAFGAASGALGIAAVLGAIVGYATMFVGGHEGGQAQAAGLSAIFTMESTLGEIAATILFPHGHFITDSVVSSSVSGALGLTVNATAIVDNVHNVFGGGAVSGALAAEREIQRDSDSVNTPHSSQLEQLQEQINIEDEVSLDEQLGINYIVDITWNAVRDNLSILVQALGRIPVDAASIKVLRSRGVNL